MGYIFDKPFPLTSSQMKAVRHGEGPLLVVAGAGTGKTLCLAHRVAHLITSRITAPDRILILTFSSRAASEMEERIDLLLPYAFSDIWVSTFHSFGRRILEAHSLEGGIPGHFKVLTPEENLIFLRDNLYRLPLERLRPPSNPTGHLRALANLVSRLKDEDITPEEYGAFAASLSLEDPASAERKALHIELSAFYRVYQALMAEAGYLDMADLVHMALQLLRHHPLIADQYRKRFEYVLVDEFQDTNHCQYELLKLLCAGRRNITAVGDDDQSIYRFRGAAISNILSFAEDFPDMEQVVLKENFRSADLILDAAYRLISHNNPDRLEVINGIDKKLKGKDDAGAVVSHAVFNTREDQAAGIAELIRRKIEEGFQYGDISVLVRANRNAKEIQSQLDFAGIPHTFSGRSGLYSRPEVRCLISFFRVLSDPSDSMSLFHLAGSEIFHVNGADLIKLNRRAISLSIGLEEAMRKVVSDEVSLVVSESARPLLRQVIDMLDLFRGLSPEITPGRLLYKFLQETGYLRRLGARRVESPEVKTRNIALFFEQISRFESMARHPLAITFIKYIDDLMEAGDEPDSSGEISEGEGVRILTAHTAKGLEFPVVIIASLAEGNFPSRGRAAFPDVPDELIKERLSGAENHIAEERRLFYVAMTRAKKELYLYGVRDFGGKRQKKISRFIMEALDRPVDSFQTEKADPAAIIERFAPAPAAPASGEKGIALSSRHFDDYMTCPLKYEFVHVFKIPVRHHHLVVYGKALHSSVMDFLRRRKEGIAVASDEMGLLLEREWVQEGFLSQEHEKFRLDQARRTLGVFYDKFYDSDFSADQVDREYRFFIDDTAVYGRWDRIRETGEGAVITRFRSSDVKDRKSADQKARSSVENRLAVLAFQKVFGKDPLYLEAYYLDSGIAGILKPSPRWTEPFTEELKDAASAIRKGDFPADPEPRKCSRCAYFDICPSSAR